MKGARDIQWGEAAVIKPDLRASKRHLVGLCGNQIAELGGPLDGSRKDGLVFNNLVR